MPLLETARIMVGKCYGLIYLFSVTIYLNIDISAFYSGSILYTSGAGSLLRFINMLDTLKKNIFQFVFYFLSKYNDWHDKICSPS